MFQKWEWSRKLCGKKGPLPGFFVSAASKGLSGKMELNEGWGKRRERLRDRGRYGERNQPQDRPLQRELRFDRRFFRGFVGGGIGLLVSGSLWRRLSGFLGFGGGHDEIAAGIASFDSPGV